MKVVANISEKYLRLHLIPADRHDEIKQAYEQRQYLWLVSVWNEYRVTSKKICPACPDSIEVVKTFIPLLWQE